MKWKKSFITFEGLSSGEKIKKWTQALNVKNLMEKTSGNAFLGHLGNWGFHVFPTLHSIMGVYPDTV